MDLHQGHYHVDVLAGQSEKYIRGFSLQRTDDSGDMSLYAVRDDFGLIYPPETVVESSLELSEAIRVSLSTLRAHLPGPVRPVWNTAPYELLGYAAPTSDGRDRPSAQIVGPDGLPA